jgi:hypothetical protein
LMKGTVHSMVECKAQEKYGVIQAKWVNSR